VEKKEAAADVGETEGEILYIIGNVTLNAPYHRMTRTARPPEARGLSSYICTTPFRLSVT
jgi:hypothetical protein